MKEAICTQTYFIEESLAPMLALIIESKGLKPLATKSNHGKLMMKFEVYDIKKAKRYFEAVSECNDYIESIGR